MSIKEDVITSVTLCALLDMLTQFKRALPQAKVLIGYLFYIYTLYHGSVLIPCDPMLILKYTLDNCFLSYGIQVKKRSGLPLRNLILDHKILGHFFFEILGHHLSNFRSFLHDTRGTSSYKNCWPTSTFCTAFLNKNHVYPTLLGPCLFTDVCMKTNVTNLV